MRMGFTLAFLLLGASSEHSWAQEAKMTYSFHVSAKYVGSVEKSYRDLGTTEITVAATPKKGLTQGREDLDVKASGTIHHPEENGKIYRFLFDSLYLLDRNIYLKKSTHDVSDSFHPYLRRMEKMLPFVYLSCRNLNLAQGGQREQDFLLNLSDQKGQDVVTLRYEEKENQTWVASLYEGTDLLAKFELVQDPNVFNRLNRLKVIFPHEHIQFTLTKD